MKKFRWILLSGLLVAATSVVQAQPQPPGSFPGAPTGSFPGGPDGVGAPTGAAADAGGISNAPGVTTTTTTTGIAPDAQFVPADESFNGTAADSSSMPNTGGEPMIAVLAGLSIAGAAVAMRRKVTA